MTKLRVIWRLRGVTAWDSLTLVIATRTSWMANNPIPDSINMNMICWSLGPPVELNDPTTEIALTSKNTSRILNTIKPVTRAFTTIDVTKPVRTRPIPQGALSNLSSSNIVDPSDASQAARGDKLLKSSYQVKVYSLTYVCDCQK